MSFSERVVDYVKARKDKIHSWFMDMNLLLGYWGATTRTYHHTAPTNSLFALHEALLLHPRGRASRTPGRATSAITSRSRRGSKRWAQVPREGAVPDAADERGDAAPRASNEAEVRKTLLNEFGLEIGAGLGPLAGKIWRFGLMGYSCRPDNVMLCLSALGSVLSDMGLPVHVGDAEAAAHRRMQRCMRRRRSRSRRTSASRPDALESAYEGGPVGPPLFLWEAGN